MHSQKYRPDIDGLRAVAVLPVVLFHLGFRCSGGFIGVDIFFVISGFLITSLILKEINDDRFSLVMFWERRIRRILPALFVVVVATLAAGWFLLLPEDFSQLGKSVVAQAFLVSNVCFWQQSGYFAPGLDTKPLLHTWSLAVEEQFYMLFPLLLVYVTRNKRFSIARTVLWLGAGSFILSVLGTYFVPSGTFYLLPTRAWELMVGGFLAAIPGRQLSNPRWNDCLGISGLALILVSAIFYTPKIRFPGLAAVPPCLGAALIIFSGGGASLISRGLALKPVVLVGLISYSLYLWHWPLLVFSKYYSLEPQNQNRTVRMLLLLVSFVLALGSWRWIEVPFRKRIFCPRRPQVFAFASCAMLTFLIFGVGVYLKEGMPSRLPAKANFFLAARHDMAFRNEITLPQAAAGRFAELGAQSPNQPVQILLWGDSHAMSVAPALDELCRRFSVRGVEATHSATAPILGYVSDQSKWGLNAQSPAFSRAVVEYIGNNHVKTVIIAAMWNCYGPCSLVDARLAETVQTLRDAGASVFVLKDVPTPNFDVPRLATLTVLHHGDLARLETSQDKYAAENHKYDFIFDHLSKVGATILDTSKYLLNTNGFFDVVRNDRVLYFDDNHLSIEGSKLLLPMFEPLFRTKDD